MRRWVLRTGLIGLAGVAVLYGALHATHPAHRPGGEAQQADAIHSTGGGVGNLVSMGDPERTSAGNRTGGGLAAPASGGDAAGFAASGQGAGDGTAHAAKADPSAAAGKAAGGTAKASIAAGLAATAGAGAGAHAAGPNAGTGTGAGGAGADGAGARDAVTGTGGSAGSGGRGGSGGTTGEGRQTAQGTPPASPQPAGQFTIVVSEDNGAHLIAKKTVPVVPGESLMDYMHQYFDIVTAYGDNFMVSINGIRSQWTGVPAGQRQPVDWFLYVNGQQAKVGAADIQPRSGDVDTWDYHRWDPAQVYG
ncbi:DUF4430 domain-containing protein [Alicyclobacillus sp.]|uniref:DUF4430 domain-containing protein n=1 Tax=Alicyclobacillus sp. TaxID=61169 RepID=UPI0025C59FC8|nr:DUF4430 domain-containing protein [Alicyclobacillus sp.]MCL6516271.1 DUF4430 domain-containing protein [Alicyclobacillus sp.]